VTSRFLTFVHNSNMVQEHNMRFVLGLETYQAGINQFTDQVQCFTLCLWVSTSFFGFRTTQKRVAWTIWFHRNQFHQVSRFSNQCLWWRLRNLTDRLSIMSIWFIFLLYTIPYCVTFSYLWKIFSRPEITNRPIENFQ